MVPYILITLTLILIVHIQLRLSLCFVPLIRKHNVVTPPLRHVKNGSWIFFNQAEYSCWLKIVLQEMSSPIVTMMVRETMTYHMDMNYEWIYMEWRAKPVMDASTCWYVTWHTLSPHDPFHKPPNLVDLPWSAKQMGQTAISHRCHDDRWSDL